MPDSKRRWYGLPQSLMGRLSLVILASVLVSQLLGNLFWSTQLHAKAELDAKTDQVLIELRKQYNLALSSVHRIDALTNSVSSANFLVEAMQKSAQRGVRTNLDTLNAQQQLFTAKRDLAQARYTYLLSYLRLRKAAGTVGVDDLQDIASYFVASQ